MNIYISINSEKTESGFGGNRFISQDILIGTAKNSKHFAKVSVEKQIINKELIFTLYVDDVPHKVAKIDKAGKLTLKNNKNGKEQDSTEQIPN